LTSANIKEDFGAGKPDQVRGFLSRLAKEMFNFLLPDDDDPRALYHRYWGPPRRRRILSDDDPRLLHASSTTQSVNTWPGSGGKLKVRWED
jgi:hypothetical protein